MYAGKIKATNKTYFIKSPSFQWFMPEKTEPLTGNGTLPGEVEKVNQGKQSDPILQVTWL